MPRFNFPLPGRRPKQQGPSVSQNKAQKLLGNVNYSIDSQASVPADMSRNWEARSSSGMSISISESTISEDGYQEDYQEDYQSEHHGGHGEFHGNHHEDHVDGGGLSSLTEGEVVNTTTPRQQTFEEESAILGHDDSHYPDFHHSDRRSVTDTSSLRRKLSSSTIMSYYDKSRVPLVISQQTSNSAMAKGLPSKAKSLLDIDGTISKAGSIKKKKPARLDLSLLIPKRKSSIAATSASKSSKPLVLGPDMVTRSPSTMSTASLNQNARPATSRSTAQASSIQEKPIGPPYGPLPQPPSRYAPSVKQPSDLQSLYDHYERMSIRDVYNNDEESEPEPTSYLNEPTPPAVRSSSAAYLNPYARKAPRTSMLRSDASIRSASQTNLLIAHGLHSPVTDCSASVSSRNTRASRASRNSLMNVDLQQRSMLSLSSDSDEEQFFDLPQTTSSGCSSQTSNEDAAAAEQWSNVVSASNAEKRSSYYASSTLDNHPEPAFVPRQTATTRFSNASLATNSTARPATRLFRSSSRASRNSLASSNTIQSFGKGGYAAQEARVGSMAPSQAGVRHSSQPYDMHHLSQPTPPLSPTSVDSYYLQAHQNAGLDTDVRSVRSGRSFGSLASLSTAASSRAPSRNTSSPNSQSRFMAVTRQEEQLLAALRMKKARMRESIIAEFEEEQEKTLDLLNGVYQPKVSPRSHRASMNGTPELYAPKPRSANRVSVNFPLQIGDSPLSVRSLQRHKSHSRQSSSVLSVKYNTYEEGSNGLPSPTLAKSLGRSSHRRQRSMQSCAAVSEQLDDDFYGAEPSPDLSDFLDFDGVSYESPAGPSPVNPAPSNRNSSLFLFPPAAADGPQQATKHQSRKPKSTRQSLVLDEEVQVHIVDDPVDGSLADGSILGMAAGELPGIPRPDSPVEASLPLPRKKAVRISAVGMGMEQALWGHDG